MNLLNSTCGKIGKKAYQKFSSCVNIKIGNGTGLGCDEQQSKLAPRYHDEFPQYEPAAPVAYDPQVPSDPKVLRQYRPNIRVHIEHCGEVL